MNDIIEINRFIKKSQCLIKELNNWKFLLYDEYNEYNVKEYEVLDLNVILLDIENHLKLKIQDNLVDNTLKKLKIYFNEKFNIDIKLIKDELIISREDWTELKMKLNEFNSKNIKSMKLIIVDKLNLI